MATVTADQNTAKKVLKAAQEQSTDAAIAGLLGLSRPMLRKLYSAQLYEGRKSLVLTAATVGGTDDGIAAMLGISESTVQRQFREELTQGRKAGGIKVQSTLYNLATSGKCVAATIFYCKSRLGYREIDKETKPNGVNGTIDGVERGYVLTPPVCSTMAEWEQIANEAMGLPDRPSPTGPGALLSPATLNPDGSPILGESLSQAHLTEPNLTASSLTPIVSTEQALASA